MHAGGDVSAIYMNFIATNSGKKASKSMRYPSIRYKAPKLACFLSFFQMMDSTHATYKVHITCVRDTPIALNI
jgi:hypothetical protein